MPTRRPLGALGLVAVALTAAAQEPTAPANAVPSPFRAYVVLDERYPPKTSPPAKPEDRDPRDRTNKMHDLVTENGLSPVVAVFVRADPGKLSPEGGVAKLVAAVDRLIPKYRGDKLASFVAFLRLEGGTKTATLKGPDGAETKVELELEYPDDENRDVYAKAIRDFAAAVKAPNVPFVLAPTKSKAIAAWGIPENAEVAVVIYNRLRIVRRWEFPADGPNEQQLREILAATEEMITGQKK
jgi:hypothetical protein